MGLSAIDMAPNDTIFALATSHGRSALAIIRLSGPDVGRVLTTMAGRAPPPRLMTLCKLRMPNNEPLDQAMVVFFPGPNSATGEDAAEFHLHGSLSVIEAVSAGLNALGLRLAEPGEFTRRAVHNGKLDLLQAEALADLIESATGRQRAQAIFQLYGTSSDPINGWRNRLLDALAFIEALLDFSDEADVEEEATWRSAQAAVFDVYSELSRQLARPPVGERIRDGYRVVIGGPPNVGKSTLLNYLAGRNVALVTPLAGTTRDAVEVQLDLKGYSVSLVDTAGIRSTNEPVERLGIERAQLEWDNADVRLWLVAIDQASSATLKEARTQRPDSVLVLTQTDLNPNGMSLLDGLFDCAISTHAGTGLDCLVDTILERLAIEESDEPVVVTRSRHRLALNGAKAWLDEATTLFAGEYRPENLALAAECLRGALHQMDVVVGLVRPDDILDRIFSSFCIGK